MVDFVCLIGFFIYLEIIELNICKLNYNLRKNIIHRGILDEIAHLKMNESYDHEQSMSVKRASKKIRKVKIRYIKLTIFLLIINFIALIIQKYPEFTNGNKNEITRKNIFLIFEDLGLKIVIIISFLK